jgi:hypothetical protein
MVLLGVALFVNTRTVSGLRLRGILGAVQNVENVHVTQYGRDETRPVQELWIARTPGLVLLKDARQEALYDLRSLQKTVNHLEQGTVETGPLEPQERANIEQSVSSVVGFVLAGIPINRELQRRMPDIRENIAEAGEVYEMTWESRAFDGTAVPRRLRVVLEPGTKLPKRTMVFRRALGDGEGWDLIETRVFEYPSRQTVDLVMKPMSTTR